MGEEYCHVADEGKGALKKAAVVSGGKDECRVQLKGKELDYRIDTEIGMLKGNGFQGQATELHSPRVSVTQVGFAS